MMKQQIEGIPANYEMVAYRKAKTGELCLIGEPSRVETWLPLEDSNTPRPILKKLDTGRPMSEFPFDQYGEDAGMDNCLFYVDGEWVEGYGIPAKFTVYEHDEEIQPLGWKPIAE